MAMRKWVRLFVSLNLSIGFYTLLFVVRQIAQPVKVEPDGFATPTTVVHLPESQFTQEVHENDGKFHARQLGKRTIGRAVTKSPVESNEIVTSSTTSTTSTESPRTIKSILMWNAADRFESGSEFGTGPEAFVDNGCSVTDCQIISNRSDLPFDQYDAVVFNMMDAFIQKKPEEEGFNRSSHQRYILLSQESPATIPFLPGKFKDFFNWTMSYRLDSDILLVYGTVKALNSIVTKPHAVKQLIDNTHQWTKNYAMNKTKPVAWMATHCETNGKRETYVNELMKYIDVDVYGGCGNLSCPRGKHWISSPKCYDKLAAKYKFYLSFENSVCHDYATEKFYEILAHDLVPVVYGGANYSKLAPPHSFINALEYTPQQLAQYLNRIVNNDTLYNEFFWWKDYYAVEAGMHQMVRHGYCELCRKLHQDSAVKMYHEVNSIWGIHKQCVEMDPWDSNSTNHFNVSKLANIL